MTDIDKLEELRSKAERGFGRELHEAYKNELFIAAPALFAEVRRLRADRSIRDAEADGRLIKQLRQELAAKEAQITRLRAIEAAARDLWYDPWGGNFGQLRAALDAKES